MTLDSFLARRRSSIIYLILPILLFLHLSSTIHLRFNPRNRYLQSLPVHPSIHLSTQTRTKYSLLSQTMNNESHTVIPPYHPPTGFAHWAYTTSPFWAILPPQCVPIKPPQSIPSTTISEVEPEPDDTTRAKKKNQKPPSIPIPKNQDLHPQKSKKRKAPSGETPMKTKKKKKKKKTKQLKNEAVEKRTVSACVAGPSCTDDPRLDSEDPELCLQGNGNEKKKRKAPSGEALVRMRKRLKRLRYKARKKERKERERPLLGEVS